MNISGLLIVIEEEKRTGALESLKKFKGLEINRILDDGRVVAVLERESTYEEVEAVKQINELDGVNDAAMVSHFFEEEVEGQN